MTQQTVAERLRIIADALDAGEGHICRTYSDGQIDAEFTISVALEDMWSLPSFRYERISAKIKVGDRMINAPLRVMPKLGEMHWYMPSVGCPEERRWDDYASDKLIFATANCWATKEDAQAYADASLSVRKGECK